MSAQVAQGFLPLSTSWTARQPFLGYVLTTLFTNYIQEICPVPVIHLQGERQLRWPTVAVACCCGYVLGLLSGGHMLRRAMTRSRREKGFFSWGFTFLWYGVMCLGGLFHHCIRPSPFFYKTDIIGTACFSLSIIPASIPANDTSNAARLLLLVIYGGVVFSAVTGPQAVLEVLYTVPMVLGAVAGAWFLWRVNTEAAARQTSEAARKRIWKWSAVAVMGTVIVVGGIVGDKWTCLLFGSNFSMLFWAFLGCNVTLFACFPIVLLHASEQLKNSNLKQS